MKPFNLFILLLLLLLLKQLYIYFNLSSYSLYEPFTKNKEHILILLGDSILKNNVYVSRGESVEDILVKQNKNKISIINYAIDYSRIEDVYNQINEIPDNLNTNYTNIVISIGGNDILSKNNISLQNLFSNYKNLIEYLEKKMNKSNIILLDIYYPHSSIYNHYKDTISEWNNMIYEFASNKNNIIKISNLITNKDDLTYEIEPSAKGGDKIARAILLKCSI